MEIQRILIYLIIFISLFMTFFFLSVFISYRDKKEKKLTRMPDVTFVIPAFNASALIEKTINAIFNLDYPRNKIKVLIVNDGSTDNTLDVIKSIARKYSNVSVLNKKNEGKAIALNYGLKHVKTPITVVLDADTLPKKDLLKKALAQLEENTVMAVTCTMLPLRRKRFLERMQVIEYAFVSFYRKLLHNISALQTAPAFTVFKTEFFKKFGYFDPQNLTEDMEMGMRIQSQHYDVGFVFDSYASTDVPKNFRSLTRQRVRWSYGTIHNLYKYRKMLNAKYGDLGLFFLPSIFLGYLLLLAVTALFLYNFIDSSINLFHRLALGWRPSFLDYNTFSLILSLTDLRIILALFVFLMAFVIFLLVKKETGEKISFIDWVLYLFVYTWMLAYFYIVALFFLLFKKPKW